MGWAKYAEDNYEISVERLYMKKESEQLKKHDIQPIHTSVINKAETNVCSMTTSCLESNDVEKGVFYTAYDFWKLVEEKKIKTTFKRRRRRKGYSEGMTLTAYKVASK